MKTFKRSAVSLSQARKFRKRPKSAIALPIFLHSYVWCRALAAGSVDFTAPVY